MRPGLFTYSQQLFIPGAVWGGEDGPEASSCRKCKRKLYMLTRHHCRWCGGQFCDTCAPRTALWHGKLHRRCNACRLPVVFRSFVNPISGKREGTPFHVIIGFLTPKSITALLQSCRTMAAEFPVPHCSFQPSIQARFPSFYSGALIGEGGFGAVYKCEDPKGLDRRYVAIKRLSKISTLSWTMWRRVETEIEAMRGATHRNVARLLEVFQTVEDLVVVMEAGDGGTVRHACTYMRRQGLPIEPFVANVVKDVASGLDYLFRERHLVHRDIKFDNIVLTADYGTAMIIDFGLAECVPADGSARSFTPAGTMGYTSPENIAAVIAHEPLVATGEGMHKGDMFSLGVVAYSMLAQQRPLRTKQFATQYEELLRGINYSGECWRGVSEDAIDFVSHLLKLKLSERAMLSDVLAHPFIVQEAPRVVAVVEFRKAAIQKADDEVKNEWVLVSAEDAYCLDEQQDGDSGLESFPRQRRFFFPDVWNSNFLPRLTRWGNGS